MQSFIGMNDIIGVWCNGSLILSKRIGVGSIPTAPANVRDEDGVVLEINKSHPYGGIRIWVVPEFVELTERVRVSYITPIFCCNRNRLYGTSYS